MVFSCIEDYIEFIVGLKDKNGKSTSVFWASPVLSLANYDVGFITSVSEQITNTVAMSDRQAVLAYRLIEKYARQLSKLGVDQPNHKHHRLGVRQLDRSSKAYINADNVICLKFPFDERIITAIKNEAKTSQGSIQWEPTFKEWQFALTEYNLSWVYAFASCNKIAIDASVEELFKLIEECEQTPYKIELQVDGNECKITNIPQSMHDYITQYIGFDDLYALVDNAGVLGYTIDQNIYDTLKTQHGSLFLNLCSKRHINHMPGEDIKLVLDWAKVVNRYPICVFNPNFTKSAVEIFKQHFDEDEIQIIDMKTNTDHEPVVLAPKTKIVYTNRVLPNWEGRIPLLITFANLMHGATKRSFLDKADKVVYYCATLPR
jgi:hypothetical protein